MTITPEEISVLKVQMEGDDSGRHENYDTVLQATHGNYYDRVMSATWQKWQGIIYEPSANMDDKRQVHIVLNLLNPIIEAKRALWSVVPQIRVPYKSLDDADVTMTDQLETVYRALWKENRMGEKLGDGGWYAALMGTAVFCVYPDIVAHRPRIVVRSPYGFYGVPGNIEQDGAIWKEVIFVTKMRGRQVMKQWSDVAETAGLSPSNLYDVIEYWGEEDKGTILQQGNIVLDPIFPNKLKRVPVVSVPNIAQPGQWWGKSDVGDAIPIISELNKRFNVENQAFADQAGAPWEAVGGSSDDKADYSLDPDAINFFDPGGGLKKSSTGGLPWQIYQSNQQLRQYIDAVTDFPEVMRSMFGGSNVSGKAINNMMGPIQARMELRQRYLYPRLEMLNKMLMETWAAYWGGEKHVLYGSIRGKRFNLEIVPNDFEGFYENEVFLDSSSYFDAQSKVIVGLQALSAGGMSIKTFIEKCNPFTDDYSMEIGEINADKMTRIQDSMMAMAAASQPQNIQPELGQPSQDAKSMASGNQNVPSPMQPPPGVSPDLLQSGAETAGLIPQNQVPQPGEAPSPFATAPLPSGGMETLTNVADLIRSTPKITGRIFLSGSILQGEEGPEGIEIWFTDMVDWATVRQYVTKQDPSLSGKFNPQPQGVPNVPFLEVTPGTSGYDTQQPSDLQGQGLEPVPGEAMPTDVGGTMAGPMGAPGMMPPPGLGG